MKLETFFDEAAKERIAAAVKRAETQSLGEIVPVVVDRCERYPEAVYRGALLTATLAVGFALLFHFPWGLGPFVVMQVLAGLLGAALSRVPAIERWLVGPAVLDQAARARAERAFDEHGLHQTQHRTGVLVFAALFEHRAVVLGDVGIDARMGTEGWSKAVEALISGIRKQDAAAGFCAAIDLCSERLVEAFPRGPGTPEDPGNELSDELRTERH